MDLADASRCLIPVIEGGPGAVSGHGRYLCSVADSGGVPLRVRIWRGCGQATRPGDTLAVVYDSKGMVPPRGVGGGASVSAALRDLGGWATALVAVCVVAVVRSYRLYRPTAGPQARPACDPGS
ncbi:hypothetical protein GR925_24235 [Streptomyces sp. HUCO-GS316]|uniref:hypothetical protein n=1 Tax=Streptomyces sp. HUCO-GS316 TaxID=2692198 RepID=UPI001370E04A|nr:hypothetical protein [Streptomyces sp. HUCO-GS316]MXM66453.1 hypothetical protein [Streptomyces sp. HUCO-GS316]